MSGLVDQFGRHHTYLRIAVTDRCNLRCFYCMPSSGIPWKPREQILSYEEIIRIARVFAEMGVSKLRLTGGEPLVRLGVESLIAGLSGLPGVESVAMTTNAVLLKDKAQVLKEAGLTALNVSCDTLRSDRFKEITRRGNLEEVMAGVDAAINAGFSSLKINCVVMSGVNDDEILDFVELTKSKPANVRFIEYMPFPGNHWCAGNMLSFAEMMQRIEKSYDLVPVEREPGARYKEYSIAGHAGTVGFITSMSDSFCASCNRLRLTADGALKSCLFYAPEASLRDALRNGCADNELRTIIQQAVLQKPESHPPADELAGAANRAMVEIGG